MSTETLTLDEDHFDRLPDSILLVIFNRISNIKSLGRCCLVSHRFNSLIHLVDNASVRIDCVISDNLPSSSSPSSPLKSRSLLSHLSHLLLRPLFSLSQFLSPSSRPLSSQISHFSPSQVLKTFTQIKSLRIELPAAELRLNDGILLKWKADFGSTIDRCVILGANPAIDSDEDSGSSFYANGGLKLRVLWTISSLIAASARHYLLRPIVVGHSKLEFLELVDVDGQGVLCMDGGQLRELVGNPVSASGSSHRTLMPALSMRLWYEPLLELPCGRVLKGATLVAIRPSEDGVGEEERDLEWVLGAFEGAYGCAAKMLMERRAYCLEMNSF